MLLVAGLCLLLSLLLILRRSIRLKRDNELASSLGCQPPRYYPLFDTFFGLDFSYKTMKLVRQRKNIPAPEVYHGEYGKTFCVKSLEKVIFYTIHPDNLKAIYDTNCMHWGVEPHRRKAMQPLCGLGYITSDGNSWERSRKMLKPSLAPSNVEDLGAFGIAVDNFLNKLPMDGLTVDLSPALNEFLLDEGTRFLLGQRFSTLSRRRSMGTPDARAFLKALHVSQFWAGMRIFFGSTGRVLSSCIWRVHIQIVHRFIDHYVGMALERDGQQQQSAWNCRGEVKGDQQRSLVSSLVEQTNDREEIRWQVIQGILGMQDTTSTLISNTLFLLSRNPAIWARLRSESTHLNSNGITATTLNQCTMLQNALKESLRLYPVFGQYGRTALRDTILPSGGGLDGSAPILVTAGAITINSIYTLHRQTAIFGDNLETFDPDRWSRVKPGPYEYLPFGNGPRRCAGQHKALIEAAYLIARLTQRFARIESRDDRDWAGDWKLTVTNVNGCKVALFRG